MSLNVMFDILVWRLGCEPMMCLNQENGVEKLDIVAETCIQSESVCKPPIKNMTISVYHPYGNFNLTLRGKMNIRISDFIMAVNNAYLNNHDVKKDVSYVELIEISGEKIKLYAKCETN